MKITLNRTVGKFSSQNKDYGKVIITSEELAKFIGKKITMEIEIKEKI